MVRPPLGQQHRAVGLVGQAPEQGRIERVAGGPQFVGGRPGGPDVAEGQLGLDPGGQQLGQVLRRSWLAAQAPQRPCRDLGASLRGAQPREPRLRLHPERVRPPVGVLGVAIGAHQAVEFTELVGRLAGGRSLQELLRGGGLTQSARPVAAERGHVRPVDQTGPAVGPEVGTSGAPAVQGGGPSARPDDVPELHADGDARAVAEADNGRGGLVRGHGQHDLVVDADGLVAPTCQQESEPDRQAGQHERVGVPGVQAHALGLAPGHEGLREALRVEEFLGAVGEQPRGRRTVREPVPRPAAPPGPPRRGREPAHRRCPG